MALVALLLGVAVPILALPAINSQALASKFHAQTWLGPHLPVVPPAPQKLFLPYEDPAPLRRRQEIEGKRHGILYGPSLLGNSSFFPSGVLGDAMAHQHQDQWYNDAGWLTKTVNEEATAAMLAITQAGGIKNLSDYEILYQGQWAGSVPDGIARGEFSNFTSDLLFAMERLSTNPYAIRRLHPTADLLPFDLDLDVVEAITGTRLSTLHRTGRLFHVDHSYQKGYQVSPGKYTAGCEAYFYLQAESDQLLPLAIKTNVGADLIYTPLDEENDWLLAKAMFNQNDLFHGQIFHLANSHAVAEIVYLAALRTMSTSHPVLALLDRLMYQAYAIRPVGETVLFNEGGFFDQTFAVTNRGVREFATRFYPAVAGLFRSNYFETDLQRRGLIHSTYGPRLSSFPFFEDGKQIISVIRQYVKSYVHAYYEQDMILALDDELQAWMEEANGPAMVIDFPAAPIISADTLVDMLTHIAWLCGVSHHVLNSGGPVATSGVLPLHPAALHAPPPVEKGVENILPFLPGERKAIEQIALLARFNRPQFGQQNETLLHMFDDKFLHEHGREDVVFANERFMMQMRSISNEVNQKAFDEEGLCQGMPFVWKGMDPAQIPFFLSV
ncbi:MAG: hypothetical protein M1821_003861 [Bathelium mastoideum]|nr:MAG: hypothetical protein M1821_003861 [Bathelium mastoideum]